MPSTNLLLTTALLLAASALADEVPATLHRAIEIEVATEDGYDYQVQRADRVDGTYVDTGIPLTGDGETMSQTERLAEDALAFFRVERSETTVDRAALEAFAEAFWNEVQVQVSLQNLALNAQEREILADRLSELLAVKDVPSSIDFATVNAYISERTEQANLQRIQENAAFLAELDLDPDIQTAESGLRYQIINEGTADRADDADLVDVIYSGRLTNGTVFDDSDGSSVRFRVSDVIDGFSEGLKLVGEGGEIILYIPPDLAYQDSARGNIIPANGLLIFDVEIVDIVGQGSGN